MLRRSRIGWCDYSGGDLNFIIGCTPISEGCANCYAAAWAKRCSRDFSEVTTYWDKLNRLWKAKWKPSDQPYRRGPDSKPIMFPVDLGDLFHPDVSDELIWYALNIFWDREDADWVLLTKRPERMLAITNDWIVRSRLHELPPNIWPMVTAENQRGVDERIPILLQVKAAILGLSIEPMLEPLDLYEFLRFKGVLDWIIVGAESGPNRRPFDLAWAEDIYEQCQAAGVPFFGKQASGLRPGVPLLLGGREVKEWPKLDTN